MSQSKSFAFKIQGYYPLCYDPNNNWETVDLTNELKTYIGKCILDYLKSQFDEENPITKEKHCNSSIFIKKDDKPDDFLDVLQNKNNDYIKFSDTDMYRM